MSRRRRRRERGSKKRRARTERSRRGRRGEVVRRRMGRKEGERFLKIIQSECSKSPIDLHKRNNTCVVPHSEFTIRKR